MTDKVAIEVDEKAGAPIIRSITGLESSNNSPDQYVDLQYRDHVDPDLVHVTARNHHPDKTIQAYFYTLKEDGSHFIPRDRLGLTIKARLKPSETTTIHFDEKKQNPRLFLFNAIFVDSE